MKNFSLYELLSYLIPGFLLIKLVAYYLSDFKLSIFTHFNNDLNGNIFLLVVALIIGVAVHRLTFFFIKKIPCYRYDVYASMDQLEVNSEELQKLIPLVEEIANPKIDINQFGKDYLFEVAYYYLEVNDKIGSAKSFQSFYFLFRNLYTILIVTLPLMFYKAYKITLVLKMEELIVLTAIILLFPLSFWCARFMRKKMFERVFWSYYIDHIHKTK